MHALETVSLYLLIPATAMVLGALLALIRKPSKGLTSVAQHFAAGLVFAAVALELLPMVVQGGNRWAIAGGFLVGMLVMIGVKFFAHRLEHQAQTEHVFPLGFMTAIAIDVFVDGLLIGIAFVVGQSGGILLAFALGVEILFLGVTTGMTLHNANLSWPRNILINVALSALIFVGGIAGVVLIQQLPTIWLTEILAFGIAALLYLVTEELLTEAHEVTETPWATAAFFIGFLAILLLET